MRLGLLGGTFDPIHIGHLELAETALRVARLDAIHFVTSVNPPHKSEKTQANFLIDTPWSPGTQGRLEADSFRCRIRSGRQIPLIDTVLQLKHLSDGNAEIFSDWFDAFIELPLEGYHRFSELCSSMSWETDIRKI